MPIRRTTRPDPPTNQAGAPATHTISSKSGVPGVGFSVPSTWPIRLRPVIPTGAVLAGRWKPRCTQRRIAKSVASRTRTFTVWLTVTGSSDATWTIRSPRLHLGCTSSPVNTGKGLSQLGAWSTDPAARSTPRPKPTVIVNRAGPRPAGPRGRPTPGDRQSTAPRRRSTPSSTGPALGDPSPRAGRGPRTPRWPVPGGDPGLMGPVKRFPGLTQPGHPRPRIRVRPGAVDDHSDGGAHGRAQHRRAAQCSTSTEQAAPRDGAPRAGVRRTHPSHLPTGATPTRITRAMVALALAALSAVLLGVPPANAHDEFEGSDPAAGPPWPVHRLKSCSPSPMPRWKPGSESSRPARMGSATTWPPPWTGPPSSAPWPGTLDQGTFIVAYRIVVADGHPVSGEISFTIGDITPSGSASASPRLAPN